MKLLAEIQEVCCPPLFEGALQQDEAEDLAAAFKVLGDPARVRLISLIAARGDGEACVCDLVEPLGLTQPTVSHHLKVLHEAGLLDRERRGSWVYHRVNHAGISSLKDALALGRAAEGATGGAAAK